MILNHIYTENNAEHFELLNINNYTFDIRILNDNHNNYLLKAKNIKEIESKKIKKYINKENWIDNKENQLFDNNKSNNIKLNSLENSNDKLNDKIILI